MGKSVLLHLLIIVFLFSIFLVPVSAVNVSSSSLGFYYSTAYHITNPDSSYGVPFSIDDDAPSDVDTPGPVVDVVRPIVTQTAGSTYNTRHFNLSAFSQDVQSWSDTIDSLTVGNIYFHFYYSFHQPVFQSVIFDFPTYPQYSLSSDNTLTSTNAEAVDLSRVGISFTDRSTGQVYEPDPSEYSIIRYSAYGIAIRLDTFLNFSGNWYLNFTFDIHPTFTDVDPSNCYFNFGCTVNNNIMYIDNTTTDQQILDTLGHINDNIDKSSDDLQQAITDLGGTVVDVGDKIIGGINDAESNLEDYFNTPSDDVQSQLDENEEKVNDNNSKLDDLANGLDVEKPDLNLSDNLMLDNIENSGISGVISSMCNGEFVLPILGLVSSLIIIALLLFGV